MQRDTNPSSVFIAPAEAQSYRDMSQAATRAIARHAQRVPGTVPRHPSQHVHGVCGGTVRQHLSQAVARNVVPNLQNLNESWIQDVDPSHRRRVERRIGRTLGVEVCARSESQDEDARADSTASRHSTHLLIWSNILSSESLISETE